MLDVLNLGVDFNNVLFGTFKLLVSHVQLTEVCISFDGVYVVSFHDCLVDFVADSIPLEFLLQSQLFVHCKANNLEVVLLEENVHDVKGLGVEGGFDLVHSHGH